MAKITNIIILTFQGWCWNMWNRGTTHDAVHTARQTCLQEMIIPLVSRCHETKKSDSVYDFKNSIKTVQTHFKFMLHIDAQSTLQFCGS